MCIQHIIFQKGNQKVRGVGMGTTRSLFFKGDWEIKEKRENQINEQSKTLKQSITNGPPSVVLNKISGRTLKRSIKNGPPSVILRYIIKQQILKHSIRNGPPFVILTFIIVEDWTFKHSIRNCPPSEVLGDLKTKCKKWSAILSSKIKFTIFPLLFQPVFRP